MLSVQFIGKEAMTQLTNEHFELHDRNKAERYERQKLTRAVSDIKDVKKVVGRLNESVGELNESVDKLNESVALLFDMIERGK